MRYFSNLKSTSVSGSQACHRSISEGKGRKRYSYLSSALTAMTGEIKAIHKVDIKPFSEGQLVMTGFREVKIWLRKTLPQGSRSIYQT